MNEHKLTLMGGLHDELRVSAAVLHEAVGALLEGVRLATRFAVEGESVRKGPPPQAARVAGTLDTISASRSDVILNLKDGTKVPARMEDHDPDALRELFGKAVVVSGVAHYRPSGRLLLLDVESIGQAGAGDCLFETAPVARKRLPVATLAAQDESSGVSAFFGTWPGDESEEALLEALQAIG